MDWLSQFIMPKQESNKKTYKKKRKPLLFLIKTGGIILLFLFCSAVIILTYYIKDMPRPEKFTESAVAQSSKIYDRTGTILLYEISGEEKRTIVPISEIPKRLQDAVISTEDANFYKHKGVDIRAVGRAILYDLKIGKFAQGASTISQQLIRSYFLTRHKTIARKTRELVLALEMERRYSKEQILEWYLNIIPFGENLYGVESASQRFFQKSVSALSIAESATIAALIQAPSLLSPYGDNLPDLLNRKDYILKRMFDEGYISKEEMETAKKELIEFSQSKDIIKAPHFALFVRDYLLEKYGEKFLTSRGLKVWTTLDLDLQTKAEETVEKGVENAKIYNAYNGALIAINPKTGEILAMVGSKDWHGESEQCEEGEGCRFDPKVNVATSLRQPGSAFKPFVYAVALQQGFTPNTIIWDVKTEFNTNCPVDGSKEKDKHGYDCYRPENYDGKFLGPISIRSALAQSRNLPAVKILYLSGIDKVLKLAKDYGITTLKDNADYGLSLVLGGGEIKLLELTGAYTVFANDGVKTPMNFIKKIEDSEGNIIEEMNVSQIRIIASEIARQINSILSDNSARAPMFGFYSLLYIPGYDIAAKTGTTQFFNDAWAIGYSPSIAVGVWVGNNNNKPTKKPGVVLAGPIWRDFMNNVLPKFPNEEFKEPKDIITGKPILDGSIPEEPRSILYFVNKNHPRGDGDSRDDVQYEYWEYGVKSWLNSNQ